MPEAFTVTREERTDGTYRHTGRMYISVRRADGTLLSLVLPDDLIALAARVTALEAMVPSGIPNSIEDLTYGG